jgi:hypothetical protein
LRGESVDLRTDVYALGLILYEMLAGRHVFAGDGQPLTSDQVSRMQLHAELSPPAHGSAHIPGYVWPIIGRALKKQRDERYASMAEMAEDIHEAGRKALREGHISVLFDGVSTPDEGEETDPTWDTAPLSSGATGTASPPESAPKSAEGPRYWRTSPRGAERPERTGAGAQEAKTMELGRGGALPLLSPALPFRRPPGEPAANDAVERDWPGLEGGELDEEREPDSEARALSRPTVRLRAPASEAGPRDVEEDTPTKRAGAYLAAVPTPPEAMPAIGKLPRHVVLALVLGPLASIALSVGLMQVLLHKGAPEARSAAEEGRAPVLAEPVGLSAQPPLAPPCPATVDSVTPRVAPISSVVPSAPMPPAPTIVPTAKGAPSPPPANAPPAPARLQSGSKPARIF